MAEAALVDTSQYLTFTLGGEVFALDIGQVREVLDPTNITRVPRMPEFLRGVINLRGEVVPIVDLRLSLGMTATDQTIDTCIVITDIRLEGQEMRVGMLADSVREVVTLDPAQIRPPAQLGNKLRTEFIRGMGQQDEGFVIILEIDRVLSETDLSTLESGVALQNAA